MDAGDGTLVNRALVETDAVVTVGAAETVLHGGPASFLAAASAEAARGLTADSLLETHGAPGWDRAVALERAIGRRVPVVGVSLTLDVHQLSGSLRGYPYDPEAVKRVAGSWLARAFALAPAPLRGRVLSELSLELTASSVFAGPPSAAHAEALVRSVDTESAPLAEPLDAIVVGVPRTTPFLSRERPNALVSAALGLGYTLRLWRDAFQVQVGGAAILVPPFRRRFTHPTQQPYRAFFQATRAGREPATLAEAERAAVADPRAIDHYRSGRTCHPMLPFADWDSCRPRARPARRGPRRRLPRLGGRSPARVRPHPRCLCGARDGPRPGRRQDKHRIGFLLSPPYFPIRVS